MHHVTIAERALNLATQHFWWHRDVAGHLKSRTYVDKSEPRCLCLQHRLLDITTSLEKNNLVVRRSPRHCTPQTFVPLRKRGCAITAHECKHDPGDIR